MIGEKEWRPGCLRRHRGQPPGVIDGHTLNWRTTEQHGLKDRAAAVPKNVFTYSVDELSLRVWAKSRAGLYLLQLALLETGDQRNFASLAEVLN